MGHDPEGEYLESQRHEAIHVWKGAYDHGFFVLSIFLYGKLTQAMTFHFPSWNFRRFVNVFCILIWIAMQYSMKVPVFQEELLPCEPDVSSSSVPYNTNPRPVHITKHIQGQWFKGDMVPYRNLNSNI